VAKKADDQITAEILLEIRRRIINKIRKTAGQIENPADDEITSVLPDPVHLYLS